MTNSTRISPTEVTDVHGGLVEAFTRRVFGRVPESIGVMWHRPAVVENLMALEFETAGTLVILDDRVARFHAVRNPQKLGRLGTVAELRR